MGSIFFYNKKDRASIITITEDIPDGYGIASYTSSFLQQMRTQRVKQDSVTVRHVTIGGTDGREGNPVDRICQDQIVRETVGSPLSGREHIYFSSPAKEELIEQYEPYFKRAMLSVHIGSAGHWTDEFEQIRAKFPKSTGLKHPAGYASGHFG